MSNLSGYQLKLRICVLILFLLAFVTGPLWSQDRQQAKALKAYEKASAAFNAGQWMACEKELLKAIMADSGMAQPFIMLGDVYLETGKPEQAVEQYRKSLGLHPDKAYIIHNLLGNTLFELERYAEACQYYATLSNSPEAPENLKAAVRDKLNFCLVRKELVENPVTFHPLNVGPGINTEADEYINAISAEADKLFFTRKVQNENDHYKEFTESFYQSAKHEEIWETAVKLDFPPGAEDDGGALCISPDGRLLFFTACFRSDSYGSCDLYYSEKKGDKWTPARNMGSHINSDHWDAQPSISSDGKTLYFASNRRGGYGSADLWKTEMTSDGGWGQPVNLGPEVNTAMAEMAPFIHYDNVTLYFSSSGHPGLGGLDLFMSTRSGKGWSRPANLGYPLNSSLDDIAIIVSADGTTGYISSNSLEGEGGFDIFEFSLFTDIMPVPVTYFKGKVMDSDTKQPLEAQFELIDLDKDSLIISAVSDPVNGEFLVCLPGNRNYALNVSRKGYLFYSENIPLLGFKSSADPFTRDIFLSPFVEGNRMILRNVFYETDQFELLEASFTELDILVGFLQDNPLISIEISGHTDAEGSDGYNLDLSHKRARTVFEYLVNNGIVQGRLSYRGYGETHPIAANETEEGRAMNRRTEIKIVGID